MTNKTPVSEHARSGSVRFGSARFGDHCECFHFLTKVCFPSRIGSVRVCSALFGLQCEWGLRRLANPCTTRHVFNVYLAENATRVIQPKRRSVYTTPATRQDASRATRSDRNGLGCQDRRRGITGVSVELRTTQAVRLGSVLIGSARVAVWVTPKASGQYLPDTSCI